MNLLQRSFPLFLLVFLLEALAPAAVAGVGLGAKPLPGSEILLDGTRGMLDLKWTYWTGPRFGSSLPIKWKIVNDPVDAGMVLMTDDPAAAGGKYGAADIVTKQAYRDFRLHIEFLVNNPGGNSGVYLRGIYEVQIIDSFGQRSLLAFTGFVPNAAVPPESFRFTPPAGADLIEQ